MTTTRAMISDRVNFNRTEACVRISLLDIRPSLRGSPFAAQVGATRPVLTARETKYGDWSEHLFPTSPPSRKDLTDRIVTDSNLGLIDRATDRHVDCRANVMRSRAVHCPTSNGKS
ncbi:unnamed protein product, partial [Protopolystoma xenopodis]